MSDKHYAGLDLTSCEDHGQYKPVSRVTLFLDSENVLTAGDDTGMELSAQCPFATREMVDALLENLRGYRYQAFRAESAGVDPAAELGDGVTVQDLYGTISAIREDGSGYPELSAPGEGELDEEYPGGGPMRREFDRKLAETRSLIEKTAEEILLKVYNEYEGRFSEIDIQLDSITLTVSDVQKGQSQLEITVGGIDTRVENVEGGVSALRQTLDGFETRVENVEGQTSSLRQTVDGFSFEVSDPRTDGEGGSYVTLSVGMGGNTWSGVVKTDGNVDISGSLSAEALYAMYGSVANLMVDALSTSRRIPRYLAGDKSDDSYIFIQGQRILFRQGTADGGEEQAKDPNGAPLYWEQDVSGASPGADGYPYKDGSRVFTTTRETAWPVMVYTYAEQDKISLSFDESGINEPVFTFGAGWEGQNSDAGKGFIQKKNESFDLWFTGHEGKRTGVKMYEDRVTVPGYLTPLTVTVSDFENAPATVEAPGITADPNQHVVVVPAPESYAAAAACGCYCSGQGENSLTFSWIVDPVALENPPDSLTFHVFFFWTEEGI